MKESRMRHVSSIFAFVVLFLKMQEGAIIYRGTLRQMRFPDRKKIRKYDATSSSIGAVFWASWVQRAYPIENYPPEMTGQVPSAYEAGEISEKLVIRGLFKNILLILCTFVNYLHVAATYEYER